MLIAFKKNSFTELSRIIFNQMSRHRVLAKLTHEINSHTIHENLLKACGTDYWASFSEIQTPISNSNELPGEAEAALPGTVV